MIPATLTIPHGQNKADNALQMHSDAYAVPLADALDSILSAGPNFAAVCSSLLSGMKAKTKAGGLPAVVGLLTSKNAQGFFRRLRDLHDENDIDKNLLTGDVEYLAHVQQQLNLHLGIKSWSLRPSWTKDVLAFLKQLFNYDAFRAGGSLLAQSKHGKVRWDSDAVFQSGWSGGRFVEMMVRKIRYCPFCNAETVYAVRLRNRRVLPYASALDHYLPRSEYPYFGLSLYNLVPTCTRCNSALKKDALISFSNVPHPYRDNVYGMFRFKARIRDILSFDPQNEKEEFSLDVQYNPYHARSARHLFKDTFELKAIYNQLFRPETREALMKLKYLTPSYRKVITERYKLRGESIQSVTLGCTLNPVDIQKYRHAKLIQDLHRQFRSRM